MTIYDETDKTFTVIHNGFNHYERGFIHGLIHGLIIASNKNEAYHELDKISNITLEVIYTSIMRASGKNISDINLIMKPVEVRHNLYALITTGYINKEIAEIASDKKNYNSLYSYTLDGIIKSIDENINKKIKFYK